PPPPAPAPPSNGAVRPIPISPGSSPRTNVTAAGLPSSGRTPPTTRCKLRPTGPFLSSSSSQPPDPEEIDMTWMLDGPGGAAVIRAAQAETLENESVSLRLLLAASAPPPAPSALRVSLRAGAD